MKLKNVLNMISQLWASVLMFKIISFQNWISSCQVVKEKIYLKKLLIKQARRVQWSPQVKRIKLKCK